MTAALEGGEWSAARPGRTLLPGKSRYSLYRRLGEPQGRSGRAENLVPTGIRSRTVQPVVSRYTDWATRPTHCEVFYHFWETPKGLTHLLVSPASEMAKCSPNCSRSSSLNYCNYRHSLITPPPPPPQKKTWNTPNEGKLGGVFSRHLFETRSLHNPPAEVSGDFSQRQPQAARNCQCQTLTSSPLTIIFSSIQMQKLLCQIWNMKRMPAAEQD